MKKIMTVITLLGMLLAIGAPVALSADSADDYFDLPEIYLPVPR